jgi:hypothetical protein
MTSGLRQISIAFVAEEDRLLLRFNTRDRKEYLLFLTRRFVLRGLWPAVRSMLSADPDVRRMADDAHKEAMMSFQHRGLVDKAAFGGSYAASGLTRPLGDEPVVATGLKAAPKDGGFVLTFMFKSDTKVSLQFDRSLMHNFCKLLIDAVAAADWDAVIGFDAMDDDASAQPRVH